ncbi:MAG: bacteriohemerythrin [bacterium]
MALIIWNQKYSVGINSIDLQHQKLIGIINELNDAMRTGKSKEVLSGILTSLTNYTKVHFKYEEDIFNKLNYADKNAHKMKHDKLTQEVINFSADFNKGRLSVSIDLMNFLSDWLTKHIMLEDKAYSTFLIQNGVK